MSSFHLKDACHGYAAESAERPPTIRFEVPMRHLQSLALSNEKAICARSRQAKVKNTNDRIFWIRLTNETKKDLINGFETK